MGNGTENLNDDNSIKQMENMIDYEQSIANARIEAENHVLDRFEIVSKMNASSCPVPFEEVVDVAAHDLDFHEAIWYASTEILPNLEVQVVIDGKNKCFVSTGSAGYVEFGLRPPIGMSLPIKCWIHTHPFGSAYFSGTDINTVTSWLPLMEQAYVLGGEGHYGFWEQRRPNELDVYVENSLDYTQIWDDNGRNLDEEEE